MDKERTVYQRNRLRLLWLVPLLAIIVVIALFNIFRTHREGAEVEDSSRLTLRDAPLLEQLGEFLQVPLKEIRLVPPNSRSAKPFDHSIEDREQLLAFRDAALRAETNAASEEGDAIFEAALILVNDHVQMPVLASVQEGKPEDLLLSRELEPRAPRTRGRHLGVAEDSEPAIRLLGLGQWIMSAVPEGKRDSPRARHAGRAHRVIAPDAVRDRSNLDPSAR